MKLGADKRLIAIGTGLVLACFLLRLIGIGWGLPTSDRNHSLHPDEELILAYARTIEPARGKFTPGFYNYGTLFLTIERVVTDVVNGYGGGAKLEDGSDIPQAVARYIFAGRVVNSLAGALAALAVFLAIARHTHWIGGLLGGLAVGITPALVVHSRFMTVDVMAMCFLTWCFYWCSQIVPVTDDSEEKPPPITMKPFIWAGVFCGLSAGTKYTGIIALVAVALTALLAVRPIDIRTWAKQTAVATGAALAVFLIVTPGAIFDTAKFLQDVRYEMSHTSTGHGLVFAGTAPGWAYHIGNLVVGYGGLLTILSLIGLAVGLRRKQAWLVGPAAFLLIQYILIGRADVKFMRYVFPLIPVIAMGFGFWMGELHRTGSTKLRGVVALGIIALGGIGGGAVSTLNLTRWMTLPDVRDEMAQFTFSHLPKNSKIGLVSDPWFYSPTLHPNIQAGPFQATIERKLEQLSQIEEFDVVRYTPLNPAERFDWDVRLLEDENPDFVIFSSFEVEGLIRLDERSAEREGFGLQYNRFKEFMDELQERYEILTVTAPDSARIPILGQDALTFTAGIHDMAYIRPQLWIWARKNDSTTPSNGTSTTSGSNEEPATTPSPDTSRTSNEPPSSSPEEDAPTGPE